MTARQLHRRHWRRPAIVVLAGLLAAFAARAPADVFRPAYLELRETAADRYDVLWKVPALDAATTLKAQPEMPPGSEDTVARTRTYSAGSAVERWSIRIAGGLDGQPIGFSHLADSGIDVLVRVERLDGSEQLGRVLAIAPTFTVRARPGRLEVARTYTLLGIEHILTGFDHLLFVLALVLIVRGTRRLLATITAFTVAHSITLALATLGLLAVPGPPVEATIALSIVFVAAEVLRLRRGEEGLAARRPWVVAFVFGLLHGLGFAGALDEVGLPSHAIPLALVCFNVGVEIGQLLFIAAVLAAAHVLVTVTRGRSRPLASGRLVPYLIGGTASFWLVERVTAFWR